VQGFAVCCSEHPGQALASFKTAHLGQAKRAHQRLSAGRLGIFMLGSIAKRLIGPPDLCTEALELKLQQNLPLAPQLYASHLHICVSCPTPGKRHLSRIKKLPF
jgi:hypothetical protein